MTKRLRKYFGKGFKVCAPCRQDGELVVREGLSMTPADIARLTSRGMSINQQNVGMFQDGEPNPSPYVTSERRRGVDVADLWEEHNRIIEKARSAAKKSRSKTE